MRNTTRSICATGAWITSLFLLLSVNASAQLTVAPASDLDQLVGSLAGDGVKIENATIICHDEGLGYFTYNGNLLSATQGVLLTTGSITNAIGPNNVENRSFQQNTPGDALLDMVTGRTTYDACRLEFDIIPSGDSISFDLILGSEEYNEWVGSQYNDVFGFFISGPGIIGDPGSGGEKNIALIPGSNEPVSINSVNNGSNNQYFHDNTGGSQIQYDGFTTGLKAVSAVQPCETYRLKLIIADASDRMFDSGVFIQQIKSNAITMEASTLNGTPEMVEGCNAGSVRFSRPEMDPAPLTIEYYIQGTATNGTDYEPIGDLDPNQPKFITIPAGASYADVVIAPINDGITEGPEYLRLILGDPNCPSTISDTLDFVIVDELVADVLPGNSTICSGGSIQFNASGGTSYSWSPSAGLNATNIANPIATPPSTTTYTATITNGSCTQEISRTITVTNINLSAIVTRPLCNGDTNGAINLSVSGGTAPFQFTWSGPSSFTATTENLVNIPGGTYTVSVTDANGCVRVQSFNVNAPASLSATTNTTILTYGHNIACNGATTGSIGLSINGGTAPYSFAWTGPAGFVSTSQNLTGLIAGTYDVTITDLNGCVTNSTRTLSQPAALEPVMQDIQHVSCHGANDGSATVSITGGIPPYTFSWNSTPVQTSATAIGLPAGLRTVTITDGYGCQTTASVNITQPAAPLSVSIGNVSNIAQCQGQNNPHGSGTATASGGTPPYSYHWNTIPVQTTAEVEFTAGGTYTVTVTDLNGCQATASITVQQPGNTSIEVTQQTNVTCNGENTGGATVTITGGSNITSIIWDTNPPQTTTTLSNVPAGTYTAVAEHSNGCTSVAQVVITESTAIGTPQISASSGVACFGDNNGSVTLDASGGTAPYTYWYAGAQVWGNVISGLSAGDHLVSVIDANGCSASTNINISGPTSPLIVEITDFTNELCNGGGQGTATAEASGGTPPYTYSWNSSPEQTGEYATGLFEGTYTVTVTDANGCEATTDVTIGGPQFGIDGMIVSYGYVTCFGANDGHVTIAVWGGSNSFTVTWDTEPPTTGLTVTGLAPGVYTATAVDNNGCDVPKVFQIEINGPGAPLEHSFELSNYNGWNTSCAGASDGWIDITVTGGNEPYNFIWSDNYGNVAGMEDPSNINADIYYVIIGDSYGCSVLDTVILTAPQPLLLAVETSLYPGGHNVSCSGAADGSADLTITGGTAPYTITWSNNQGFNATTEDISGLGAGVYDLLVTDVNGCTASTSITLTAPVAITLDAVLSIHGDHNVSCANGNDGSIDLTVIGGNAPFTYDWNNGDETEDLNDLQAGTYFVSVTDANGCNATASYELTAPAMLELEVDVAVLAGGYGTSCSSSTDGSISATLQGGIEPYTIAWTGPDAFTSDQATISNLAPGTYTITITDSNGCIATSSADVTAPQPITIMLNSTSYNGGFHVACAGASTGSIVTNVNGGIPGYTFDWSGPGGFSSSSGVLSGLQAGTYFINVTDVNDCNATDSISLIEPDPLDAQILVSDAGSGFQVSCNGNDGSISLNVSGGTPEFQYSWNGPGGFGSTFPDITGLDSGTYELSIMDANGCTSDHTVVLTAPTPITASFTTTDNICPGGMAASINTNISGGAGGYDLAWSGPDNFSSSDAQLTNIGAGVYQLNITDALGCSGSASVSIQDPAPIQSGTYVSFYGLYNLQCVGDSTGVIELYPSGGTAPYEIAVNGPNGLTSDQAALNGLIAGDYLVTITDANNCAMDTAITLTAPTDTISASFDVSIFPSGTNVSCHGFADGWIEATVIGGSAPYEIFWRGPDSLEWNMANIYNLPAGNYAYELVIIDANQCTYETAISLTQPDSSITASHTSSQYGAFNISCADANDGSIDVTAIGGNGGFTYEWSGPGGFTSTSATIGDLPGGDYVVTIVDMNGCTLDHAVQLNAPLPVAIEFNASHIDCHGYNNGMISVVLSGGTGTFDHTWVGPNVSPNASLTISELHAASYCLEVIDSNGCATMDCIAITSPDAITAIAAITSDECGTNSGTVDLGVEGGVSPYTYIWSNGSTTEDVQGQQAGSLTVEITDQNGCITSLDVVVEGTPAVGISANITDVLCNGESNGAIDLAIIGGAAPFSIMWNTGAQSPNINGLQAGTYSVTISDANGCTNEAHYTVMQSEGLGLTPGVSSYFHGHNISAVGASDGWISINVSGGTAPYTYSWSTGAITSQIESLPAGTYSVEVTDVYGCSATLVIELTAPHDLEMPTGFSPNGDGANDYFLIRGLDAYPANTFTVFNRWGNVVYDRLNYRNDWAGDASNGEPLANGTYFAILTVENGSRTLQGYVDMRR